MSLSETSLCLPSPSVRLPKARLFLLCAMAASGVRVPPDILGLAWLMARGVLAKHLGLAAAPSWRRGFDSSLGLFCLLLLRLYLVPLAR